MIATMEIIDGEWIKRHLPAKHGSKADLARALGLQKDQVTKMLKGERRVQPHEIPAVLRYFKAETGLAEAPAAYESPDFAKAIKPTTALENMARLACPRASRPFYYRAQRSEPMAAILAGDTLIMIHGPAQHPGDLVLVSMEGESGEGINSLRRYLPPVLATLSMDDPYPLLSQDDPRLAIIGRVAAVIRAPNL